MKLTNYVVDTEGLSAGERAELCRQVVSALEETAVRFEADIPWTRSTDWPANVRQSAETLVTATGKAHSDEPYQQTGLVQRADEAVWQAFATFAGYAFDASVWSDTRVLPIVSLSDEGASVVVLLDETERRRLQAVVQPARVVLLSEAHADPRGPH